MRTRDCSFLDSLDRGMYFEKKHYDNARLYTYEEVAEKLPMPVVSSHPEWRECYDYALKVLFRNTHKPTEESGFVSNFVDAAFNKDIFLWDTCFMTMFCNLLHPYIPGICSLDNFYCKQFDDGEIPREMIRDTGKDFLLWVNAYASPLYSYFHNHYKYRGLSAMKDVDYEELYKPDLGRHVEKNPYLTLDNLNHPILAFAEWQSFRQTGDVNRLAAVFPPLLEYFRAFVYHLKHKSGLYVTDWASMDNSARNKGLYLAVDTSSEMVLFASHLLSMLDVLERNGKAPENAGSIRVKLNTEKEETREAIRTHLWDEETHFFYDLNQQMEKIRIKTAAAFWTIIAGVADDYQTEWLCNYLEDEKTFNRLHRVPSLAADEEAFDPKGNYWNGSVWAPLNAMIVTGLEDKGKHELARNIALNDTSCIADIFKSTGTIWENYPADYLDQGYSDHPDMVGWSGMAPILFFIKYGVGLSPAADGSLNWDLRFIDNAEIVACSNYWWMGKTASLKAEKKDGKVAISITGCENFRVRVLYDGNVHNIDVHGSAELVI